MERVAVIILNWNGERLLREYLPSVIRYTNPELGRVIVVDNHSTDTSVEVMKTEFPQIELICFEENYGFAGGYNRAVEQIEAEYVLLLNSDVRVCPGWLEPLVALLDKEKEVAAVQPKLRALKEPEKFEYAGACGGYMDDYGFPFCRGRILGYTEEDWGQYDDEVPVFWCSGAALCVRRDVYRACGGLDERFFAHMEEIDLCWRMRNAGYVLKVVPCSVVYHLGGGSLPMHHPRKLFLNYRNNLLMLHKNMGPDRYTKVMRMRKILDGLALGVFLLKGQPANARAVREAYRSFRKMKKEYPVNKVVRKDDCIYPGSLLYACFVRRIRTFSALWGRWRKTKG